MRMIPIGLAALGLMVVSWLPVASAQSPAGMKLYVLNSGSLKLGRGVLQNFGPMEPKIEIPVGMFVIHHPKGNVMFDTGNNDKLITDHGYWGKVADSIQPGVRSDNLKECNERRGHRSCDASGFRRRDAPAG